jgi:bacillithiol system protein YtxJ
VRDLHPVRRTLNTTQLPICLKPELKPTRLVFNYKNKNAMDNNWNKLEDIAQIDQLKNESKERPVLIFKHSTRCSISAMAWDRLKRNWKPEDSEKITPYYLDLIRFREISNLLAKDFDVEHESPQVIIVKKGVATYHNSHMGIDYKQIISNS